MTVKFTLKAHDKVCPSQSFLTYGHDWGVNSVIIVPQNLLIPLGFMLMESSYSDSLIIPGSETMNLDLYLQTFKTAQNDRFWLLYMTRILIVFLFCIFSVYVFCNQHGLQEDSLVSTKVWYWPFHRPNA